MERDDIIEYSLDAHHSEEEGKKIRKEIYKVTWILSIITIVEVGVGIAWGRGTVTGTAWELIKAGYVILTLVKAFYIVYTFMHLGDERKVTKKFILYPYMVFIIYLFIIAVLESTYIRSMLNQFVG